MILVDPNELKEKIEMEGGLGYAVQYYYGREVNSNSPEINRAWRRAYDVLEELRKLLRLE